MVTVTEKALAKMSRMADQKGVPKLIRVGVERSGCAGYKYVVDFAEVRRAGHTSAEFGGVTILCAQDSLQCIEGAEIDYSTALTSRGFKVSNSREQSSCECGLSVSF